MNVVKFSTIAIAVGLGVPAWAGAPKMPPIRKAYPGLTRSQRNNVAGVGRVEAAFFLRRVDERRRPFVKLRAVLRVQPTGQCRVLLPMVTGADALLVPNFVVPVLTTNILLAVLRVPG